MSALDPSRLGDVQRRATARAAGVTFSASQDLDDLNFLLQSVTSLGGRLAEIHDVLDGLGYEPFGWDERKELANLWQEHARLPEEGLSNAVYNALIAVANAAAPLIDEIRQVVSPKPHPLIVVTEDPR